MNKLNKKNNEEQIIDRISRIEGQLRGIKRMVEERKECLNIINQISAIREAVNMLGVELLKNDLCNGKKELSENHLKSLFKFQ